MTIDHRFLIKKLQTAPEIYCAFSQAAKLPFVTCDPESFNDQIHIFPEEKQVRAFVNTYSDPNSEKQYALMAVRIEQKHFLSFYGSLYYIGINAVVLHEDASGTEIPLEEIVRRQKDPADLPPEKRPITNPELMLTALYFTQEIRRPIPAASNPQLKELDEELVANLVRARYLSAVIVNDSAAQDASGAQFQVPYIKNNKDEMYQVLFSDGHELSKFDPAKKLRPVVLTFDELEKFLVSDAKGFVLNPKSISLPLRREQLPAFRRRILG